MKIHDVANKTRRMSATEFARLKESIAAVGLLQPIVVKDGAVLDGRHRLQACQELGIEPVFREAATGELLEAALAANYVRRHDSSAVRALEAAELTDLESEKGHPPGAGKLSTRKACEIYGVSLAQLQRARIALMYGSTELVAAIQAGFLGLPINEGDVSRMEEIIHRERSTVPIGTVRVETINEPTEAIREIKRLKKANAQLRAATKASDTERSLAEQLARVQAELAAKEALLASQAAQAEGGLGVAELLEPRVVIQRDTTAERELATMRRKFEEADTERKRSAEELAMLQLRADKAVEKAAILENRLQSIQDTDLVLEVFSKEILQWRSHVGLVAAVLKRKGRTIDLATEKACAEVASRLNKIAEILADNRASPGQPSQVMRLVSS